MIASVNTQAYGKLMGETGKDRLGRDAWIEAGLELLAEGGVAAVGVEPLAARLGVTKGSFYWHFRNRAALLEALCGEWVHRSTETFIARVEQLGGTPSERLRNLLLVTAGAPKPLERAIRAWAATDADVAARVAAVDVRRTAFVTGLLAGIGHGADEAAALSRLLVCFVVGETMRGLAAEPADREIYARLLSKPPG